ncbi:MAG TPA: PIN domain protein, partial [Spirochaetota bacterium]|nr:PIN domain protein [Spirochaetota bacterium]
GCFDEEFKEWSNKLFDAFKSGKIIPVISDLTLDELEEAPKMVLDNYKSIPEDNIEFVFTSEETKELANKYILNRVVSKRSIEDAEHIAIATMEKVNVLASWNFKHIVKLEKIHGYNAVNLMYGYQMLEIRTPREVIDE